MAAIGEATPKVGKTHAKHCRFILDELDISGAGEVFKEFQSAMV